MSRKKTFSTRKKIALLAGAAALVGGTAVVMTGTSQASVVCDGLATALGNNESFIAAQKAAPDALSEARIANRVAVIEEIKRKQTASGCQAGESNRPPQAEQPPAQAPVEQQPPAAEPPAAEPPADAGNAGNGDAGNGDAGAGGAGNAGSGGGDGVGEVVCAGSTVTLSGEAGAPAASSNQFPAGTTLRVTNLDNDKSTTVQVTSVSGSCALLNDAAFEQVREPGKFLIRNARIERVQSAG
ncbi:septal ring lytic transglycosylase RlpA family protein [Streptomyces sp. GMY02]|uniref:septal ring lytic transglycosylase RlpA family protein n=1 Tax=Streptomyces sp. GMY02 TaxID=1333528 RepID=UPI001C2B9490|nr:septal ring lytic transglycosylase RlpA family protein [Streptomyces sp. GMY02]QXE37234.1 septal ring lytic transglycosylase RlpA family protein [Streptomyces sp. GMY02]